MSDGEFLGIQPTELKFPFELKKQSSCSMQVTNKTDQYVAFKVKTTNSKKYCVRPNTRIVLPRSTCDVTVTMQAQKEAPSDMQCNDKFLLQSVITHNTAWCNDLRHNLRNEPGKVVDEFKLRVTYVPAGPPSPVPEEPEEGSSTLENGLHSLQTQDSVSRSSEPSKEKSSEALAMISKLTEEKHTAIQQNQKASAGTGAVRNQEYIAKDSENASTGTMDLLRKKTQRGGVHGALIGYIIKKL